MVIASELSRGFSVQDDRELDVVCVGAALMDHLVSVDFDLLDRFGLVAGTMSLVETDVIAGIRAVTGEDSRISGGAEANTAVGVACFGANAAFVGAVATDDIGAQYARDLELAGVRAVLDSVPTGSDATATGSSFVIVTPDAERTMLTALGVAPRLDHRRIDDDLLSSAKIIYFSAYALDFSSADDLVARIVTGAASAGTAVALSLADPLSVARHRDRLRQLASEVDLVFANESEAMALTGANDVESAIAQLSRGRVAFVTRGAEGAIVGVDTESFSVTAEKVDNVVDATGAGDLFAAGVLYGITAGVDLLHAARLGALSAAEIIGHLGARPVQDLKKLAAAAGLSA